MEKFTTLIKSESLLLFTFIIFIIYSCNTESYNSNNLHQTKSQMFIKNLPVPKAEKKDHFLSIHEDQRNDPYYWMRLSDEQKMSKNPDTQTKKVLDYLNSENEYKESMLSHVKKFRKTLFDEMVARIKKDDDSVPYLDNGYYYISKYIKGQEYPFYYRKKSSLTNPEELLFDVNKMADKFSYYSLGNFNISPNNNWVVYAEDTLSRRIYTLKFKNLKSGKELETIIEGTSGDIVWANDNKTIFYVLKNEQTLLPYKVMRHNLGDNPKNDVTVYEEKDNTFYTNIFKTTSKEKIVINLSNTIMDEYYIIPSNKPSTKPSLFLQRKKNHEFSIDHFNGQFYIRTNRNAKNFKLMVTPDNKYAIENWKDLIPHRPAVLFEGFNLFNNFLVTKERIKGISNIRVMNHDGSNDHYVNFGEDSYVANTSSNYEPNSETLRMSYSSMTIPNTVYDYNMNNKTLEVKKQQEIIGGYDNQEYKSERIYAKVRDGAQVPISIVYKKGTKLDGTAPLLLYGYGSYGSSMEPYFSTIRLSLLNRGFIYAIAHIRGGMEMGKEWYENGKMLKKKNTFRDFIDCGKLLINKKYTNSSNMYALGGSAGGLLMGAVINMAPELFNGVIAAVPFVDVLTTMLDESIPLTTGEFDEWGNPKKKEYYDYIKSYSPYDNIEKKEYPSLLITTGLHDSQVQYWEPAKWIAKLRDYKTDNNPLLLHTEMKAGHGGASGRFERLKTTALEYAFFLDLAGKAEVNLAN